MTMKILIVRHGDPYYPTDSLTEKGFREAELLKDRLVKEKISAFYCSPLGRAQRTAEPTLKALGAEAETLRWLREFDSQIISPFTGNKRGAWDLPPYMWCKDVRNYDLNDWVNSDLVKLSNSPQIFWENAEGVDEVLSRYGMVREGMLYRGGEDKTIAFICHFCLGITILAYLLGISPIVAQNNFFLAPTSVTTLVTETDSQGYSHFRATGVGDISHLYAAGEAPSESGLYPDFEI